MSKKVYWILILLTVKTVVLGRNNPDMFVEKFKKINVNLRILTSKYA